MQTYARRFHFKTDNVHYGSVMNLVRYEQGLRDILPWVTMTHSGATSELV